MNKMNKKGFTLIEMLVVIAIIAVLVSIIVPVVANSTDKAKCAADAANLRSFAASVAIDYMDNNTIDGTYTAPVAKYHANATLEVYNANDQIVAVYKSGNSYYDVNYYSFIAENGAATKGTGENAPAAAAYSLPAGAVKLYPVAQNP